MERRSFAMGILTGIAVSAVGWLVIERAVPTQYRAVREQTQQRSGAHGTVPDVLGPAENSRMRTPSQHNRAGLPALPTTDMPAAPGATRAIEHVPPSLLPPRTQTTPSPKEAPSNSPSQRAETELSREDEARAKLESESRDEAWAYSMEQAITSFLTHNRAATAFEITYVECRSTRCQIKVRGYDRSTEPTWRQLMYEMQQEPWNDFNASGDSIAVVEGRPVIIQDVFRRTKDQRP